MYLTIKNRENLVLMAEHIAKIPQKDFSMQIYRGKGKTDSHTFECNTVGCILGHCVQLDKPNNIPWINNINIDFTKWSMEFVGISPLSNDWSYLFSPHWVTGDNTPHGASRRILYYLHMGLPRNWREQIMGIDRPSYLDDDVYAIYCNDNNY